VAKKSEKPKTTAPAPDGMRRVIRIAAKPDKGFRRAGMHHPKQAVEYPIDSLTDEQIEALQNEPMLDVEIADVPAEKESE
jgi:hypothetical protein